MAHIQKKKKNRRNGIKNGIEFDQIITLKLALRQNKETKKL